MTSKSIDISREQSVIMRGMAIIFIMLHNYCHFLGFTVEENESSFSKDMVYMFFDRATELSDIWIYDFFSFLGWYGVPVFIFLTGFGLVRKYGSNEAGPMKKGKFLYDNWLKLFALLLPAVLYFVGRDIIYVIFTGDRMYAIDIVYRLFLLTFLNDIFAPWTGIVPGAYWYFGLTLEFYILYVFLVYRRRVSILILLTIASVALQMAACKGMLGDSAYMLWWVRKNITGWMVPFAFGILYARVKTLPRIPVYAIIAVSAVLFLPVMTDPLLWQISLLCAVTLAIVVAKVSSMIPCWRNIWIYIGRLSPFLFAAHPILRTIFLQDITNTEGPDGLSITLYVAAAFLTAIIYKKIWQYLTPRLKSGMDKIFSFSDSHK